MEFEALTRVLPHPNLTAQAMMNCSRSRCFWRHLWDLAQICEIQTSL